MSERGTQLMKRIDSMFSSTERENQESNWELLSEFITPNNTGNYNGQDTPGGKRTQRVYDSTAPQANHELAAAIHGTLTNPASQWFKARFSDDDLNNDPEAVGFVEQSTNTIMDAINESNFNVAVASAYQSYTSLGTMVLFHDEKPGEAEFGGFSFKALSMSEVAFSENMYNQVDAMARKFKLTARQAVEKFGDKVSMKVKDAAERTPEKEFEFVHWVAPRDPSKVRLNELGLARPEDRPFECLYIECGEKEIMLETGYYEFPAYIVRWSTMPGEVYGRGPGHLALPDIRSLNKLRELGIQALARAALPPMFANQRGILGSLDIRPGGLSILKDIQGIREFTTNARFDVTQYGIEEFRNSINRTFFLDKLTLPPRTETGEMTAFEIAQRVEQMQRVLGPTLARLNSEFLSPLIIRCFKMMLRKNALGEVPQVLQERGIDIDIVYVNQLARAQKIEDATNIQSWLQDVGLIAQAKPEILDYVNADGIAKHLAKIRGVPEIAVTNDDEVGQIRQQRQQQIQQQQALEAGSQVADIASKVQPQGGEQQ